MNILLPPRLFGPIPYYALMYAADKVAIDRNAPYNKADKDTHRFTIADTRGPLRLTVPVSRPAGARLWSEVTVSDHGRCWDTMPIALDYAYGRTPFYEFYIDRLMPLFTPEPISVIDLCTRADAMVRAILNVPAEMGEANTSMCGEAPIGGEALNAPSQIGGDAPFLRADFSTLPDLPRYWQVRADSLGFIPGLSVLDLIFNLGPEAQIYLQRLSTSAVDKCVKTPR